ncbi:MAG: 3-hydroxyacyl-ACP dehydratase FabZ [Rhodospirillales bacterium]|jgi:3-hydroxyacyl-[acyl-carrier-protein] dehydratase|nr:3-hydroxyacyl-ACP dehydratase FabZ [Rhodospirillales bacterium]MBT4627789.1 3-hydroxyacyl-ACP dehydratase FabZ [Rhodospirillales bacterium]MBT5350415.1 3-hydroxyacyl-ACP dehydratase FabZ [Rhodospirillales bacterium]MBT5519890.1 3-hydroxyacyl-ACP dehydratase FabZ [Rhodospirillales bacterium]MBT6109181.1 3-hydroxyacyl-ACP dehydratase FabZ [Rhodospirillales bacterium]
MNDGVNAEGMIEVLDVNDIMKMIPHRYPFLLIDGMRDIVPSEKAVGIKNVSINENFFQGHFPGQPIMPGVLLVEAMAQTAGVTVVAGYDRTEDSKDPMVYFMTIDSAKFRKPVVPGDVVELHVEKIRSRGNVWKFKGEAYVDGTLKAEAVFSAMIVEQ